MFSVLTIGALVYKYPKQYKQILHKVKWANELLKDVRFDVDGLIRKYVEITELELLNKWQIIEQDHTITSEDDEKSLYLKIKKRERKEEDKEREDVQMISNLSHTLSSKSGRIIIIF